MQKACNDQNATSEWNVHLHTDANLEEVYVKSIVQKVYTRGVLLMKLRRNYFVSPEADVADLVDLHLICVVHPDVWTLREGKWIMHRSLGFGGKWPFSQGCLVAQ